jgi:uncharacterized radical SAM superfamily Fe-S cluster-containing enzyme
LEMVVEKLLNLGVLHESEDSGRNRSVGPNHIKHVWPERPHLSAPETIHWAVTFKCNSKCPDCYATRHSERFGAELDTVSSLQVVDKISEWGVFQLAIGGGEPLLRQDLCKVASKAKQMKFRNFHVNKGTVLLLIFGICDMMEKN